MAQFHSSSCRDSVTEETIFPPCVFLARRCSVNGSFCLAIFQAYQSKISNIQAFRRGSSFTTKMSQLKKKKTHEHTVECGPPGPKLLILFLANPSDCS